MVTIWKLNKLTDKQLDSIRHAVATTRDTRRKAEKFAQALFSFSTKTVDHPKVGSRIARVYIYNFVSEQHPDYRQALTTCGRFVEWGKDHNSVVTSNHQSGISAGYIINLTDAAMQQLQDEFFDYVR